MRERICEGDLLIVSGTPSRTCLPPADIMLKLTEQMIRARAATACLYGLVDCITCCKASAYIWQELGMQRSAQLMGGALANILGNYVLQRLFALLGERLSTHKQKMLATSPSERIIRCWPEIFTLASAVRRPPFLEISRHVELIPVQLEFICSRMKLHTVRVRNESKVW